VPFKISNKETVAGVKKIFHDFVGLKPDTVSVEGTRFFCLGKELKNEFYMYSYDMTDDMVIQAMVKVTSSEA